MKTITSQTLSKFALISVLFFSILVVELVFTNHANAQRGGSGQPVATSSPGGRAPATVATSSPGGRAPATGSTNTSGNSGSISLQNPLSNENTTLEGILQTLLNVLVVLATPIVVIFIILAGFKYVTAQGEPAKIEEAKRALVYAIIGGVLIIGAVAIAEIIASTIKAF